MKKHVLYILIALIVGALPLHNSSTFLHSVRAHKFYASLAEINYNEETRSLEVSLRIFADDLERTLTKRERRAIYLDRTPGVAKLVTAYLQERFEVRGRDGKIKQVKWVGMESKIDSTWLYFEIPITKGLDGARLRNRILLEMYAEQVNTTIVKVKGKQQDFIFKTGDDDWKPLKEVMNQE